jgi:hypothetical protein
VEKKKDPNERDPSDGSLGLPKESTPDSKVTDSSYKRKRKEKSFSFESHMQ